MKIGNWFYAEVVNPQINPNLPKRENWTNISNAVGKTEKWAYSNYTHKTTSSKDKKGKKVTTTTYNYPYTVTAHQFGVTDKDLPDNAYLKKVTFRVRMKKSGNAEVDFPRGLLCIYDNKAWDRKVDNTKSKETGWHNGLYLVNPKKNISKNESYIDYVLNETNLQKYNFKASNLKSTKMGIDLIFDDIASADTRVYLKSVALLIEYELPKYSLSHNGANTTSSNPRQLVTGVGTSVTFNLTQSSKAYDYTRRLELNVPWGVDIESLSTKTNNSKITSKILNTSDKNKKTWEVKFNTKGTASLTVNFLDYTHNKEAISVTGVPKLINNKEFWFESNRGWVDDYNEINIARISPDEPHKRHQSCFAVTTRNMSGDGGLTYYIGMDKAFDIVPFILKDGVYVNPSSKYDVDTSALPIRLDVGSDERVSIASSNINHFKLNADGSYHIPANIDVVVEFNAPSDNEEFDLWYTVCLKPDEEGTNNLNVTSSSGISKIHSFDVKEPYTYHIGSIENDSDTEQHERMISERINFINHRIATNIETGAFILPCSVKDGDAVMIQDKPRIHMYKWEELDYIGCVPLEHLHFDPKSTYKDNLISNTYKNKKYMGKQLAPDETITLNVRLHPKQVTTIQGLIDMDKPIPINANHLIWEGDALNHRGWAEIYSITAEETNPHWYKCDIDVKYLTHNLNTRFEINRGDKTFNYPIPALLAEINSSGDSLSNESNLDFFVVDTDGTFYYDEDTNSYEPFLDENGEEVIWNGDSTTLTVTDDEGVEQTYTGEEVLIYIQSDLGEEIETPVLNQPLKIYESYITPNSLKNRFTLDEGQHLSIKSQEPLTTINQISFSWSSSKLSENKENNISRIIRLIDAKTDDVVFEYEYCDFDFEGYIEYEDIIDDYTTGLLSCRVIGRCKNQGDYDIVFDDEINLATDVETEESTIVDVETEESFSELKYFGSTVIFQLNNNILSVTDEGYNGQEISRSNIKLEGNQYYWESYWVNNNTDGEDADITSYIDIVVQDSVLETDFADKYSSLYISPFPVSDKRILFTREAEEGVIYYLEDNKEEFTYLIEPYYQYHNGVDIRASVDSTGEYISVFNLNYGYKVIYLENGLVSLGINRLNGKMYLRKYDPILKEYVELYTLQLEKYDDININSISDDRIELQASDTTIIMYRGHPYVIFKHELENIGIGTKSYKVWGQKVDNYQSEYPAMFDLMNKDNLLPMCVTGKLDDDCISLEEHTIDVPSDITITLKDVTDEVFVEDTVPLTVTGQPTGGIVRFLVRRDDEEGFDEIGGTNNGVFHFKPQDKGAYHFIAVYVGDDNHSYSISNEISFRAGVPSETQIPTATTPPSEITPSVQGNYALKVSAPSTMYYMDNSQMTLTLTYGGKPVQGKTLEFNNFKSIHTGATNKNGQVSHVNNRTTSYPAKYQVGGKFWQGGKLIKQAFKTVTVKKAPTEFALNHKAGTKGNTFSVKLRHKITGKNLANEKVTVTINGKKYERKTNSRGNVNITMKEKGTFKYKCVYNGSKGYESSKFNYREQIK